jgi:hypothetical protein
VSDPPNLLGPADDEWRRLHREQQCGAWEGMARLDEWLDPVHSVHFARYLLATALQLSADDDSPEPLPKEETIAAALELLDEVPSHPPWGDRSA